MTISELERKYKETRELLLRGEIDEDAFKVTVEKLRFDDSAGRQWKLGWYTGRWYRYEKGEWVRGEPEGTHASPVDASPPGLLGDKNLGPSRRFFYRWLVAFLAALLVLTSVILVRSLKADWWDGPLGNPAGMATAGTAATAAVAPEAPAVQRESSPVVARPSATGPVLRATATGTASGLARSQPQPTLPAPLPRLHGRIYYPVYDDRPERKTFDIYAMQLDTGEKALVVADASQPASSPDGKRLAYRSWAAGAQGIGVLDLERAQAALWIDDGGLARPSWSPDGQRLVLCAQQGANPSWRIVQATGTSLEPLRLEAASLAGQVPVWQAGTRIAFQTCLSGSCGLYSLDLEASGASPERLIADSRATGLAVAPDGGSLALMSERGGNWDIYLLDLQVPGAEPARLTHDPAREGLPAWSPDGQWLAFASDRTGAWAVWIMRPDGSEQHRLFSIGGLLEGRVASVSPHAQPGWTWETMAWGP